MGGSRLIELVVLLPVFLFILNGRISGVAWAYIFASALVHSLYLYTLGEAYARGELSLVYPIDRSAPIFIVLWSALVCHEPVTIQGILGVSAVIVGAFILQLRGFSWQHLSKPFVATLHNPAARITWITTLIVATYSLLDDRGVSGVKPLVYLYLIDLVGTFLYFPYLIWFRRDQISPEYVAVLFIPVSDSKVTLDSAHPAGVI